MRTYILVQTLAAGDGPDDQIGLGARGDGSRERRIWQLMGEVLLAGVKPEERSPLARDMIADRAAEHGIAGFQGAQHRVLRDRRLDFELHLALDTGEDAEVIRKDDADHWLGRRRAGERGKSRSGITITIKIKIKIKIKIRIYVGGSPLS
jgi:hypothetical protein